MKVYCFRYKMEMLVLAENENIAKDIAKNNVQKEIGHKNTPKPFELTSKHQLEEMDWLECVPYSIDHKNQKTTLELIGDEE